ncbi:MAG: substrate-binding domain-containing protein [Chloroflexi bacterium]|nr:substrate-binding domain-containing protein [Chloroflexota bacterium]
MYRKSLYLLMMAVLVVAVVPFSGLLSAQAAKTTMIGVSVPSLNDAFYIGLSGGAQAAATDLAVEAVVMDANNDAAVELANVQAMIADGVSALLISPVDDEASRAAIQTANEAGVPVLVVAKDLTIDLDGLDVVATLSPHYEQGGWLAASVLCDAVGGTGTVVELVGDAETASVAARAEGFSGFMAQECSGVAVVQFATVGLEREAFMDQFAALLRGQEISGVFAFDAETTLMSVEASIIARKTNLAFVGFDASDEAMAALQQGRLQAIITPAGWKLGAVGIDASNAHVNGIELPSNILIHLGVLDLESLAMFRGGPGSGSFEGDPRSGSFEGGPGSGSFEGGPGSGSFEGGPGSGSFEGGPGSGSFEGGPGSGSFEGGPGSGSFE